MLLPIVALGRWVWARPSCRPSWCRTVRPGPIATAVVAAVAVRCCVAVAPTAAAAAVVVVAVVVAAAVAAAAVVAAAAAAAVAIVAFAAVAAGCSSLGRTGLFEEFCKKRLFN